MPAGVSWAQYSKFLASAMLAMMAGSQAVHLYYKPLEDLPVYIEREQKPPANQAKAAD
ncbi:protein BRAWNIN [Drosophila obscura]|uniref:protein BRAWNIN n=1 Tax=Drosophila obscura TaxID=7282 RepID=UPI000BA01CF8|nr:protein BRAWNIN [Drosophila obscura]